MKNDRFFIEVDCLQRSAKGNFVSGDVYLQKRYNNRIVMVLSDGGGNGIKANVTASVIASMAIGYTLNEESVTRTARSIVETFARHGQSGGIESATFTMLDIHEDGTTKIVEFRNPPVIRMKGAGVVPCERQEHTFRVGGSREFTLYITEFKADAQDRIILFSNGVVSSGAGTRRMPNGWTRNGLVGFLTEAVSAQSDISARELCRRTIAKSESNDLFVIKNDLSCLSVYFRQPRRIVVSTGPPFDAKKDAKLAEFLAEYKGTKVICGGTTAQIVAREWNQEPEAFLEKDPSGLPPTFGMKGIDLITEGVLTLGKVKTLLDSLTSTEVTGKGTDARLVRMLLEHDVIDFVIGTRINPMHQDPTLPVELELRRNVIKEIARQLESKFMKGVSLTYI